MILKQTEIMLSPSSEIYDIVVPKDNYLRQLNELVDFSFVYDKLKNKYCHTNGRNGLCQVVLGKIDK